MLGVFVVDAAEVTELCSREILFQDALGYLKVNDITASLHGARADAAAVTVTKSRPAKALIENVLKFVTLFKIGLCAHSLHDILNEKDVHIVFLERLKSV